MNNTWKVSILLVFMSFVLSRYFNLFKSSAPVKSMSSTPASSRALATAIASATGTPASRRLPVYFFSHGGPTFMYPEEGFGGDAGAFKTVKEIGSYIKDTLKPDFLIYVSAHWQSDYPDTVEVAYPGLSLSSQSKTIVEHENELIYDFFGFPSHMYKEQFHTLGSKELAEDISKTLRDGGLKSHATQRGIDHGVWVPLKVAFTDSKSQDSGKLDIDFPLVQVSLTSSPEFDVHFKLGQLLSKYRDRNGLIITSGMSVHNLRDMRYGTTMPYASIFNKVVTEIVSSDSGAKVLQNFDVLKKEPEINKLYRAAHPTSEHFLPLLVGVGAAGDDTGVELYTNATYSLGWNTYQWGK